MVNSFSLATLPEDPGSNPSIHMAACKPWVPTIEADSWSFGALLTSKNKKVHVGGGDSGLFWFRFCFFFCLFVFLISLGNFLFLYDFGKTLLTGNVLFFDNV